MGVITALIAVGVITALIVVGVITAVIATAIVTVAGVFLAAGSDRIELPLQVAGSAGGVSMVDGITGPRGR